MKKRITISEAESALCVYEWLLDTNKTDDDVINKTIRKLFDDYGWAAMRSIAIEVGLFAEQCWLYADKHMDHLTSQGSFDWDFCPVVCHHIEWEQVAFSNQYSGTYKLPSPKEFLAVVVAKRALDIAA